MLVKMGWGDVCACVCLDFSISLSMNTTKYSDFSPAQGGHILGGIRWSLSAEEACWTNKDEHTFGIYMSTDHMSLHFASHHFKQVKPTETNQDTLQSPRRKENAW